VPVAPTVGDDAADTIDDDPVLIDVLANDFDANFDELTIVDADTVSSAGGAVEIVGDQLRYTAAPGTFFGPDEPHTFSYTVSDGTGFTSTATVSVTVFDGSLFLSPVSRPAFTGVGLNVDYYELNDPVVLPDFSQLTPYDSGALGFLFWPSVTGDFALSGRSDNVGAVLTGFIDVPEDAVYEMFLASDDGSKLWVGDELIVDNDGLHAMQERSGIVGLREGLHPVRVEFFERTGGAGLIVSIEGGGIGKRDIPPQWLVRESEPPVATACDADFDSNGAVGGPDLITLLGAFGTQTLSPFDPGDVTGDSAVNGEDLIVFLGLFGESCSDG
jgi:hypothetical protein